MSGNGKDTVRTMATLTVDFPLPLLAYGNLPFAPSSE